MKGRTPHVMLIGVHPITISHGAKTAFDCCHSQYVSLTTDRVRCHRVRFSSSMSSRSKRSENVQPLQAIHILRDG